MLGDDEYSVPFDWLVVVRVLAGSGQQEPTMDWRGNRSPVTRSTIHHLDQIMKSRPDHESTYIIANS